MNSLNSYSPKGPASCCASPRNYLSLAPAGPVPASNSASLNCSPTTVKYKLEHGQISLYHGKRHRYDAQAAQTLVYYAHPYTSCEKGGVEWHNRLIRRFIPKGKSINDYDLRQIYGIEEWCNNLPRKILAYHTPDELYERRLDCIYQIK